MRAFAVLAVIAFHALPAKLPGGFTGVDVFFVISGFLISSLILDQQQKGSFSLADFYGRRIRRLMPALLTVLAGTFVAGWFILLPREFSDLDRLILSGVFFVPNIQLWSQAGYFAGNADTRPLLHLWSLGVEEQFYLFWPWVLILSRKSLPWILGLLAVVSFVSGIVFINRYPDAVFYLPMSRLWELLAGAFLAWRASRYTDLPVGAFGFSVWRPELLSLAGVALLIGGYFLIKPSLPFPGWWALPPVVGTMLLIAAGPQATINRFVLANPVVVFIGLISYPLYLWHWPVLIFWKIVNGGQPPGHWIYVAVVFLLSWLTYRVIEKPIRHQNVRGARRPIVVPALLTGGAVMAAVGVAVISLQGLPQRFDASLRPFLAYDYSHSASYNDPCFLTSFAALDEWKESRCVDAQTDPKTPLVVLWGDSHAAHLTFGLRALQRDRKFRVAKMTGAGCPPFFGIDIAATPFCHRANDFFMQKIAGLRPDIVVVTADYLRYVEPRLGPFGDAIEALKRAGVRHIVVIGPVPSWKSPLPVALIGAALRDNQRVPLMLGPPTRAVVPEAELRSLAEKAGVSYISVQDALCPTGPCVTMAEYGPQHVVSMDYGHFTDAGSLLLMQRVGGQLFAGVETGSQ
jgi:peptidoglycan/LPS O-acetylase OafA/YrhL